MKKKIISMILAAISVFSTALIGSCGEKNPPAFNDYKNSTLQFDFYGYSSTSDGRYNWDGTWTDVGEDFRTVERVKEYKEAGMTIYFPQSAAAYSGQDWETSQTKKALDNAVAAGLDKVILNDPRIQSLSKREKPVIGPDEDQYPTEEALDAFVAECMEPYRHHEAFYGIMLGDEPFYFMAEAYGQMYRSVRRVAPDCYIQYNLNPITAGTGWNSKENMSNLDYRFPALEEGDVGYGEDLDEQTELILRYEKYLKLFLDGTGTDVLQYDQYPFRSANKCDEYYLLGLQVASRLCKERNLKFYFVTQTYGQQETDVPRMLTQADLYWLNNMLVGFGIKQISYFTYFTKSDNTTEHFIDGNSFITWRGEKTDIYYWMQQIMKEEQRFAPTVLNFEYNTSKIYVKQPTTFNSAHAIRTIETPDFVALKNASFNKECGLITELYDAEKDNYLYMVQNIVDPIYKGSKVFQTCELQFNSKYKYAAVYVKGEKTLVTLNNGKLTLKHKPGEATYVLPY